MRTKTTDVKGMKVFGLSKDRMLLFGLSIVLLIVYLSNLEHFYTVWEIYDEACYLFNASICSNTVKWQETFAYCNSYYGWGYSILLVPLFWFCKNCLQLIRGAIVVNTLLVVASYYQMNKLIKNLADSKSNYISSIVSFVFCLFPYVYLNANKINCEVCVFLVFLLICNLIFELLEHQSIKLYFALAFLTSYIYAVHARTIVILLVAWAFLLAVRVAKRDFGMKILVGFVVVIILFLSARMIKTCFLGFYNQKSLFEDSETVSNLFSQSFFSDRIMWFLNNIPLYVLGFIVKYGYLVISTCGLVSYGIFIAIRSTYRAIKHRKFTRVDTFELYCLLAFGSMLFACLLTGLGSDFRYLIYGRYYEYAAIPLVLVGVLGIYQKALSSRCYLVITIVNTCTFIVSWRITEYYPGNSLALDTNRLSGITGITSVTSDYLAVVLFGIIMTVIIGAYLSSARNAKYSCAIICVVSLLCFGVSDRKGLESIKNIQIGGKRDWMVLSQNITNDRKVYFVADSTSEYWSFYTRLQVMLYDKNMTIISYEDIGDSYGDSYFITMTTGEVFSTLQEQEDDYVMLDRGQHFAIFGSVEEEESI